MADIRPEQPEDAEAIRKLILEVFTEAFGSGEGEAGLVEQLRLAEGYDPRLSLVAVEDGEVVGHVMFSEVEIVSGSRRLPALALAPLGVDKRYRRRGIGTALVRRGLAEGAEMGYCAAFVVGAPAYYGRFGFVPVGSRGLTTPFPKVPDPNNMVVELTPGSLEGVSGAAEFPPVWDAFK